MKKLNFILLMAIALIVFQSCNNDDDNGNPEPLALTIGDFHEGGVIFYLDATGKHGLLSSVSDQSFEATWGCTPLVINGADGLAIGTGAQNTIDIVNGCSSTTSGFAADLCNDLELNGFSDWFLPSKEELSLLYQNREIVNETATANSGASLEGTEYWTSSHQNSNTVWVQSFNAGNQSGVNEDEMLNVRAIRAF